MEALILPMLERACESGPNGEADRAALHKHGALPALRRLAVEEHRPAALHLTAVFWCVYSELKLHEALIYWELPTRMYSTRGKGVYRATWCLRRLAWRLHDSHVDLALDNYACQSRWTVGLTRDGLID